MNKGYFLSLFFYISFLLCPLRKGKQKMTVSAAWVMRFPLLIISKSNINSNYPIISCIKKNAFAKINKYSNKLSVLSVSVHGLGN
ncbi:hypothetical protein J437_LFUL001165 [Ladona fulva]|uniref:Secreted protein n=1 Tax=Ladona fulva TaxID=123851 RepID=A0A8K0JV85_LADFU|nr:hypothetical protein J437_LFUL001165 [Ladona fulva]